MRCPKCGGEFSSTASISKLDDSHVFVCEECREVYNVFYFKNLAEEMEAKTEKEKAEKEKAEAELTRIMAIIEKNPYPETVFKKITDEEFNKIHEILQREMNMPIDRLSGEYMRMLRKQILREIKAEKAKEGL